MIQTPRQNGISATVAAAAIFLTASVTIAARTSLADTDPASDAPAVTIAPPDIDALIDENPDFTGIEHALPPGIDRSPAVLPQTATDDDTAFPNEDSD